MLPRALVLTAVAALAAGGVATWGGAQANPVTQDACGGTVEVTTWTTVTGHVLENLAFADGDLFVSDSTAGAVVRFEPAGTVVGSVAGPSGGLALGADGLLYAGVGNNVVAAAAGTGASKVVRWDPTEISPTLDDVSAGFDMANGMTFGPDGTLYVSNDVNEGLVAIDVEDGTWHLLADVWGANGLVVTPDGATLYAAITFDQRSPIEAVALDGSGDHHTAVQLTVGVADLAPAVHTEPDTSRPLVGVKGLDDMTSDAAGVLYPVANGMGELLRVDPATGDACLITGGLQNPSSVRLAPEDGGWADDDPSTLDFWITEFSGRIVHVAWTPAS